MRAEQTSMDLTAARPIEIAEAEEVNVFRPDDISAEQKDLIRRHRNWLDQFQKEYPLPSHPYRIGIYIRYFNQTKYKNYLYYHKKQFEETIALCPLWTLVDFYVAKGPSAPNIESAPELCRLLNDCREGKVNLVITQKISNMSRKAWDLALIIRMLTSMNIGVYFISEDPSPPGSLPFFPDHKTHLSRSIFSFPDLRLHGVYQRFLRPVLILQRLQDPFINRPFRHQVVDHHRFRFLPLPP